MKRSLSSKVVIVCIFALITALLPEGLEAGTKWVELKTKDGKTIQAIYGTPDSAGKHPAVIYNHGLIIRKMGYYEKARRGYDVKDFVEGLASNGFAAIAPIRETGRVEDLSAGLPPRTDISAEEWTEAIEEGLDLVNSSMQFLKSQPDVAGDKIGVMGFSEGGLITFWSPILYKDLKAVVIMSPGNMGSSSYRFRNALKKVDTITAPVFLTFGDSDSRKIRDNCFNHLIPKMERLGKTFEYKVYNGDHRWFQKVRKEYWDDIISFFNKHLK